MEQGNEKSGPAGRRALTFIFLTMLLDVTGLGIIIPVTPELIMELTGEGLSEAALFGGGLLFAYSGMQFLFAPVIGNLSDRFGRRPVLLLSLTFFALDYVLMGLAPSILWLFVGRLLSGISGATTTTAAAYIADVSPPEKRAANFGLIGAAFGLGFIIGPVLGGLLGQFGPRVPFLCAAGLSLCTAVYGWFVLPETLDPAQRRPFSLRKANPFGALKALMRYPVITVLMAPLVLFQLSHHAHPSVWSYYTMLKYGWTEAGVGYSLGVVGLVVAVVHGWLTRVIIPGVGEVRAVWLGLIIGGLGFAGFALAPDTLLLMLSVLPWAMVGIAGPALRGIMSRQVPANAQGELQGGIGCLEGLTAIIAPPLMTRLFHMTTEPGTPWYFPGAVYMLAAVLMFLAVLLFARGLALLRRNHSGDPRVSA